MVAEHEHQTSEIRVAQGELVVVEEGGGNRRADRLSDDGNGDDDHARREGKHRRRSDTPVGVASVSRRPTVNHRKSIVAAVPTSAAA